MCEKCKLLSYKYRLRSERIIGCMKVPRVKDYCDITNLYVNDACIFSGKFSDAAGRIMIRYPTAAESCVSRNSPSRHLDVSQTRNVSEVSERFSPGLGVVAKSLLAKALILVPTNPEYSQLVQSWMLCRFS